MVTKFEPQSAAVWAKLARVCTKDTMEKLKQKLKEAGCYELNERDSKVVEAMFYAVIIGAYHTVAEEAIWT